MPYLCLIYVLFMAVNELFCETMPVNGLCSVRQCPSMMYKVASQSVCCIIHMGVIGIHVIDYLLRCSLGSRDVMMHCIVHESPLTNSLHWNIVVHYSIIKIM